MKVATTIELGDWAQDPRTRRVMEVLNGTSHGRALFVGGCVRNAFLKQPVKDIDMAVSFEPHVTQEIFDTARIQNIPTGVTHGTITAVVEGQSFEVTSLRRDVETDGRRAVVAYTDDWHEDAQRRDFTMNTLLADVDGSVFDPTGRGVTDLRAGRVVFVGDPAQRIAEDVLRILRFFRFHLYYGQGEADPAALEACRQGASKIAALSRERVTQEYYRILEHPDPRPALRLMYACGVLVAFSNPEAFESLSVYPNKLIDRLICTGQSIDFLEENLIISKAMGKAVRATQALLGRETLGSEKRLKTAMYYEGREVADSAFTIQCARGMIGESFRAQGQEILDSWEVPTFPITGQDLIDRGHKPGPALGERLKDLERRWVRADFDENILT